jgi:WD40 repeat protein
MHLDSLPSAVEFIPDGKTAVTSTEQGVQVWALSEGLPIREILPDSSPSWCVAIRPDGGVFATGGLGVVRLWDTRTHGQIGSARAHDGKPVLVATFSPDGTRLLTGGADAQARLWEAATGFDLRLMSPLDDVRGLPRVGKNLVIVAAVKGVLHFRILDGDGKVVADTDEKRLTGRAVKINDLREQLKSLWPPHEPTRSDKNQVITAVTSIVGHPALRPLGLPLRHGGWVRAIAFDPERRVAVTGCNDGTARLWDLTDGRPIGPPLDHKGDVVAVAISPDGKTVLTGSADWVARLWDAATGRPIGPGLTHHNCIRAVAFAPDGHTVLTGGFDRLIRRWDVPTPVTGRVVDLEQWVRDVTGLYATQLSAE